MSFAAPGGFAEWMYTTPISSGRSSKAPRSSSSTRARSCHPRRDRDPATARPTVCPRCRSNASIPAALLRATCATRPSTNERRSSTSTIRAGISGTTARSFAPIPGAATDIDSPRAPSQTRLPTHPLVFRTSLVLQCDDVRQDGEDSLRHSRGPMTSATWADAVLAR
jgi:hypothetical protein